MFGECPTEQTYVEPQPAADHCGRVLVVSRAPDRATKLTVAPLPRLTGSRTGCPSLLRFDPPEFESWPADMVRGEGCWYLALLPTKQKR
jgi:hypothetical protein